MKLFSIILIIIVSFSVSAKEVKDPMARIQAFVAPLKADGIKGMDKAMEEADLELNKFYVEAARAAGKDVPSNDQFKNSLKQSLEMHGKVSAIRSTQLEERLKGSIKRYTLELEFSGQLQQTE